MSNTDIEQRVQEIIAEQLGIAEEEITLQSTLSNDLGADFLDLLELLMTFEDEFQIEIPVERARQMKTVGDLLEHLVDTSNMN